MSTVMKKQSASAKVNPVVTVVTPKSQAHKRVRDGTNTQVEGKTQGATRSSTAPPPVDPLNVMEEEMDETQKTIEDVESAVKKKRIEQNSNGHKARKMADVLAACHKTKFLPLADGMFTTNVYFQPIEVVEAKRTWVDVKMREVFIGGGVMAAAEPHVYAMEADDLLRMLYLGDMIANDEIGMARTTFEQWTLDAFAKVLEGDSRADYADRGRIAADALHRCEKLSIGMTGRLQFLFQKRCIYDFEDVSSNILLCGENSMGVKTKSTRGKFEYMIEIHLISIPVDSTGEEGEEGGEMEDKKKNEEGAPPPFQKK